MGVIVKKHVGDVLDLICAFKGLRLSNLTVVYKTCKLVVIFLGVIIVRLLRFVLNFSHLSDRVQQAWNFELLKPIETTNFGENLVFLEGKLFSR